MMVVVVNDVDDVDAKMGGTSGPKIVLNSSIKSFVTRETSEA
jgi:hypothetical protein